MTESNTPHDPLSDALGISSEIELYTPGVPTTNADRYDSFQDVVDADYDLARENITNTLLTAADALGEIVQVAKQSQAPRAYEVVATLTKTIIDGNKDLLDLAKKKKELSQAEDSEDANVINNNLIVTTDQLQKLLKDQGVVTTTRELKLVGDKKNDKE